MKKDTNLLDLSFLFAGAFQVPLAFDPQMHFKGGVMGVQCLKTGRWQPLEGFAFSTRQDECNALRLLNWMHWAWHGCGLNASFRPPLVVIEGPPMSGKSFLLKRLSEIAEGPLACFQSDVARSVVASDKLIFAFDCNDRSEVERQQFELLGVLTAEMWEGRRLGSMKMLRSLIVMMTSGLDLPYDLNRRAIFIRLGSRS